LIVGHCLNFSLIHSPILGTFKDGKAIPKTIEDMYLYILQLHKNTKVGIDNIGRSEGIVVRTADRKVVAKIRFEDYERTLGIRGKGVPELNKLLESAIEENDTGRISFLRRLLNILNR